MQNTTEIEFKCMHKGLLIKSIMICFFMMIAAMLGTSLRPTIKLANQNEKINLDRIIPLAFGEWYQEESISQIVTNPVLLKTINKIYSQTLTRTYVNRQGIRVMLSIAYGEDQRDLNQLHYPEICYPAQGFQVTSSELSYIDSSFGTIRVKHLLTSMGSRSEPVTYWTLVGNKIVRGGLETKLVKMEYALHQQIPDGLLFRVSTITPNALIGFEVEHAFIKELLLSLSPSDRLKIIGMPVF